MMVLEELVTFIGKSGKRRATIFFEKEYIQPYKVEFHNKDETLGSIYYLTKERAEESAQVFAFGEDENGNRNV
jgi:hypothetical protein